MSRYTALIERLEQTTAANYALEVDLHAAIGSGEPFTNKEIPPNRTAPPYTASIDAALRLVELVMPGVGYFLTKVNGNAKASLLVGIEAKAVSKTGSSGSMPIAICLALLRALEALEAAK